jgi:hypothetical protein
MHTPSISLLFGPSTRSILRSRSVSASSVWCSRSLVVIVHVVLLVISFMLTSLVSSLVKVLSPFSSLPIMISLVARTLSSLVCPRGFIVSLSRTLSNSLPRPLSLTLCARCEARPPIALHVTHTHTHTHTRHRPSVSLLRSSHSHKRCVCLCASLVSPRLCFVSVFCFFSLNN